MHVGDLVLGVFGQEDERQARHEVVRVDPGGGEPQVAHGRTGGIIGDGTHCAAPLLRVET